MALPSGYTPLEYIESTGSQYVDTGFKPNQNTRVVMEFQLTKESSNYRAIMGVRDTTSDTAPNQFVFWNYPSEVFRTDFFGTNKTISGLIRLSRMTLDKNKNVTTIGGQTITNTAASGQCTQNLYLFCVNEAGTAKYFAEAKGWPTKVYDNGTLVRDYIPVQRLDGTVGLLDQVNNVFYPDAAGGNFIAGPLAAKPEAPASLDLIGTTRNAAVLAWPGAPVGQSYRLYRDGVVVYEGSALCYTDAGLAAGSAHAYSVHTLSGSTESEGVIAEATTTEGIVLITDRTAADVSAGRRKGYYNALDLIRVGEAMLYAQSLLAQSGFSVSIDPKLDWNLNDIPTQAQMERYLTDLRTLRSAMDLIASTPQVPDGMSGLTISRANDIETIIESIEYTVDHVFAGLFRLSQFDAVTGDRRPIPTANSDMGRNWGELDAMETTWANWELATWYLLLYGNLKEEGVVS